MFWKMCLVSVNGAMPIHCAPSAPMCVPITTLRPIHIAIVWQPMPAETIAALDRLRRAVVRAARAVPGGARGGRQLVAGVDLVQPRQPGLGRLDARLLRQAAWSARGRSRRTRTRRSAAAAPFPPRRTCRRCAARWPAVEHVLREHLEEGALLLDDEDLLEARARTRARSAAPSGTACPSSGCGCRSGAARHRRAPARGTTGAGRCRSCPR